MTSRTPLLVVGDALLDRDLAGTADRLAPDAPVPVLDDCEERLRPGGAALAAYLAARAGRPVTLVTPLGTDPAARQVRELLEPWLRLVPLPTDGPLPEKTRVMAGGRPVVRLDRGAGRAAGATERALEAVAEARAILVADYARGTADVLRDALAARAPHTALVWDPHPRGRPPVPGARLVTPTGEEARRFAADAADADGDGDALGAVARTAAELVRRWHAVSVAVTLGGRGALLSQGDSPLLVPTAARHSGDACGAGDCFAATAAGLLGDGALPAEAVQEAVAAATRYVAEGGPRAVSGGPSPAPPFAGGTDTDALRLARRVRAAGGTVVAAGGCFDLLHAGHVSLLQQARGIGDCLIVCLNSDASVRRRKGDGRPINPLHDRIRVLRALQCVDAVAVFDEDTPEALLSELRPHIWVKGGDYAVEQLPEAPQLASWGGQAVLLPYLDGRSSTLLATRAASCAERGGLRPPANGTDRPPAAGAVRAATAGGPARTESPPDAPVGAGPAMDTVAVGGPDARRADAASAPAGRGATATGGPEPGTGPSPAGDAPNGRTGTGPHTSTAAVRGPGAGPATARGRRPESGVGADAARGAGGGPAAGGGGAGTGGVRGTRGGPAVGGLRPRAAAGGGASGHAGEGDGADAAGRAGGGPVVDAPGVRHGTRGGASRRTGPARDERR
ncbi:D-glycero-beta-D-manno-heptose 1-phosphate adenylyltransferase [Streptomyces mobaraensis NBRC 13819 = DSM 40847]|uniref:D-glycero-beta-D-manno-heptose 1-phosphate adenylyltransferase n=1 Tax=Streptomyces mobaraensis (strain ATCC 29032 / DSM 40847 / JCM 4168 / NBRC 13819 / NCIMB 11159 / IPCR 16-22) TaxID=1223523 RepID=M3CAW7_STRM1|nr:bifunctional synthase/transferase [Streptomyces mobaraensis NBRC 13819 = DSM 40847]QTT72330.1 D-glycero-beta-D-manno-heptose 1-phosphate adenylyltransferase [Streptomyces mobaraensis NBRC 13819 = DSM 40847]